MINEGGSDDTTSDKWMSTEGTHLDADTANQMYALLGVRLKSTTLDAAVSIDYVSLLAETSDDFEWVLYRDPTVAGTFSYSDYANTHVQRALGDNTNTITGGVPLAGGFIKGSDARHVPVSNDLFLSSKIDGTPVELVLCVRPLTVNLDIQGGIQIKEST